MMTVITQAVLQEGSEPEWDAAMRERLESAYGTHGWIGGQLLIPLERLNERVVVGTWETPAHGEAWHQDEAVEETRARMGGVEQKTSVKTRHEVVVDKRRPTS